MKSKFFIKIRKYIAKENRNRPVLIAASTIILVVFVLFFYALVNFYIHQNKTYSNLYIANIKAGNLNSDEIVGNINHLLDQTQIELNYDSQKGTGSATDFGIYADEESLRSLAENKSFLTAFKPWFLKESQKLKLRIDDSKTISILEKFKSRDFKPAKNAEFVIKNNKLLINKQKDGFGIDHKKIAAEITENLSVNLTSLSKQLEVSAIRASITEEDIRGLEAQINGKINGRYEIVADGSVVTANKKQIAGWIKVIKDESGSAGLKISSNKIKRYVQTMADKFSVAPVDEVTSIYKSGKKSAVTTKGSKGRVVTNIDSIAEEITKKLAANESYKGEFILTEADFKKVRTTVDDTRHKATYTYDVAVWGSVKSDLTSFKAMAAETLADSRGWSSGGVTFREVPSGGNFTLVLAEPSRVAAASGICSSLYSCRVGRHVIINDDRWRLATTSWNNGGGALRDYRHMVINHETGHWLGFGHRYCSGTGQLAPVMQQQSISLQGCRVNPWPTPAEIASL